MLEFFRRYQKFFYIVITTVIIISFSFFGTYGTLTKGGGEDKAAFTAIDGRSIPRSELERMVVFLQTDRDDKRNLGGLWGPNFLNDGVVAHDFLETGIAAQLLSSFQTDIASDLEQRQQRERTFRPYQHPDAGFLSAELAWSYFVPDLKGAYDRLRQQEDASSPDAIAARIDLYLQERKFPASSLRQVLRYQERQYEWLRNDPRLVHEDLSLFRYHTVDDWFGTRFMHLVAQFIMNGATLATERGYSVSADEALVELMRMNDRSFQENAQNPDLGVTNSREYFREQLRRMRLTESEAIKIWQTVLLFRRLFDDVGTAVFVDRLAFDQFSDFANMAVEVDSYQLPDSLHLGDFRALQKFETYISAVRADNPGSDLLLLPRSIKNGDELKTSTPELVQRRYLVELSELDLRTLQSKVGVRATWDWQVSDEGWALMTQRFPELATKPSGSTEERFAAIEALDARSRTQADQYAREQIVQLHKEWLQEGLDTAKPRVVELSIRLAGGKLPILGVDNRQALIDALDKAPIAGEAEDVYADGLKQYTGDQRHFYRIKVLEREQGLEVLTFAEADELGVLDELTERALKSHYEKVRTKNTALYGTQEGGWKPLAEVRTEVAKDLFAPILKAIEAYTSKDAGKDTDLSPDLASSQRLKRYMDGVRAEADAGLDAYVYQFPANSEGSDKPRLSDRVKPIDQWKLWKTSRKIFRSRPDGIAKLDLFGLASNSWSDVATPTDGSLAFYRVLSQVDGDLAGSKGFHMDEAFTLLGQEARSALAKDVLALCKERHALDVSYIYR